MFASLRQIVFPIGSRFSVVSLLMLVAMLAVILLFRPSVSVAQISSGGTGIFGHRVVDIQAVTGRLRVTVYATPSGVPLVFHSNRMILFDEAVTE